MARVMIVDDEPSMIRLLSRLMKSEDHQITAVNESSQAQKLLMTEKFDLMISDIRMEPVDGVELLKTAKKRWPEMPVILVTAYQSDGLSEKLREQGAFACLLKPFRLHDILTTATIALTGSN